MSELKRQLYNIAVGLERDIDNLEHLSKKRDREWLKKILKSRIEALLRLSEHAH